MKQFAYLAIIFGLIAVTTQDITRKKGCDCSICQEIDNQLTPWVSRKRVEEPGCSLCERKKELLRQEKERQQKLQKCPFEILGAPAIKGKTSEEIFDEFRELIVPSQNSFFDMMRGIVKTMHVSSEAELKWAKEKEAKELAMRKAEEAKKRLEAKKGEIVKAEKPESPKVTVVLKQKPCGQFIALNREALLSKRYPKEVENVSGLQLIDTMANDQDNYYMDSYLEVDPGDEDLMQQLFDQNTWTTEEAEMETEIPQETTTETDVPQETATETDVPQETTTETKEYTVEDGKNVEISTESPYVKFMSNEEFKAQLGRGDTPDIEFFTKDMKLQDEINNEVSTVSFKNKF